MTKQAETSSLISVLIRVSDSECIAQTRLNCHLGFLALKASPCLVIVVAPLEEMAAPGSRRNKKLF